MPGKWERVLALAVTLSFLKFFLSVSGEQYNTCEQKNEDLDGDSWEPESTRKHFATTRTCTSGMCHYNRNTCVLYSNCTANCMMIYYKEFCGVNCIYYSIQVPYLTVYCAFQYFRITLAKIKQIIMCIGWTGPKCTIIRESHFPNDRVPAVSLSPKQMIQGCMHNDVVCSPKAVRPRSSSRIANEDVLGVGDPERGRDLVGVEKAGGPSCQHPQVT